MVKNCDRGLENAARGRRPKGSIFTPEVTVFHHTDRQHVYFFPAVNWFCSRLKWACLRNFIIESAGAPSTNDL